LMARYSVTTTFFSDRCSRSWARTR
jgi:hypothetical protein